MTHQQGINFMANTLQQRFLELWRRCLNGLSLCKGDHVYQRLLKNYSESDRYYHDVKHLLHCLAQFDQISHLLTHPDALEMALWFHDAVYAPGCPDNEEKSAELFMRFSDHCFSDEFKHNVKELILITRHQIEPTNEDECFIVDIDLSSFGLEWREFLMDTANLRKEQVHVPDQVYFQAHTHFLKYLLAKERIFYTDFFYTRFEQTALLNINRLLSKRTYQGYH